MRAYQFLLEYRRDITITKQGDVLVQHARGFDGKELTGEEILEQLEAGDPTKNKMYVLWLIRQYLNRQFRLEDMTRIRGVLRTYHEVKNRLPLEQRDIGRMTYYALEDLVDSIVDAPQVSEPSQYSQIPDLEILYDGPYGFLAIPKTEEASCAVGSGTRWCTAWTASSNQFHYYNSRGKLYVWIEKGDKYQFHFESQQFMDSSDRPISSEKMHYFRNTNPITKKLFMEREREMLAYANAESAYRYSKYVIQDRWAEAEPIIMKDLAWAYAYAREVIRGRWAEAEPQIMKHPRWAYAYASDVIDGRWEEAEPFIMKDPQWAFEYANEIIRGRWVEAEPYIMEEPQWGYRYVRELLGKESDEFTKISTDLLDSFVSDGLVETDDKTGYKLVFLGKYSIEDLIAVFGNEEAKSYLKVLSGDGFDFFDFGLSWKDNDYHIDDLLKNEKIVAKIKEYVSTNRAEELNNYMIENDISEDEIDWKDFIESEDLTEIEDAINFSVNDGHSRGAESQCINDYISAIDDFGATVRFELDDEFREIYIEPVEKADAGRGWHLDSEFYICISKENAKDVVMSDEFASSYDGHVAKHVFYINDVDATGINLSPPYYGYNDYDESAAIDSFLDHHYYDMENY